MRLSIIIPVYNEERSLTDIIPRVVQASLPADVSKEVIVVNDGSTDRSRDILQEFSGRLPIKVVHQEMNQGKTAAILRGIQESKGDCILIQDADLEYSPEDYPELLNAWLASPGAAIYGSRFKGRLKDMTLVNRLANILSNQTFNLLFRTRLTDINTCYKLIPREFFQKAAIRSSHFCFETEVSAKLIHNGYRIVEVPIRYAGRTWEKGKKMNWGRALQMFWGIIKYRFSSS